MTEVYSEGILVACVCTDDSLEEAIRFANTHNHPGTSLGWQPSKDTHFATGAPNPCPCDKYPDTHKHYLLEC